MIYEHFQTKSHFKSVQIHNFLFLRTVTYVYVCSVLSTYRVICKNCDHLNSQMACTATALTHPPLLNYSNSSSSSFYHYNPTKSLTPLSKLNHPFFTSSSSNPNLFSTFHRFPSYSAPAVAAAFKPTFKVNPFTLFYLF